MRHEAQAKLIGVQGIFPTPFKENQDVDYDGLACNVQKDIANGFKWLTCTGTGGEFYTLTTEEHKQVIRTVCEAAKGHDDVAVVPCVGSTSLRAAIELTQAAEAAGADAVMVTPPFYLPAGLKGLKAYYAELARNTSIPFDMYYYPEVHHTVLPPQQLAELLLENDRFIAMKETSLDPVYQVLISKLVGEQVNVISGACEYMMPDTLLQGGKGFVWTWMHILPHVPLKMWEAAQRGDYALVAKMRDALLPFLLLLRTSGLGSTSTYKMLDEECGFAGGPARYPNMPTVTDKAQLKPLIEAIWALREHPLFA